MSFSSTAKNGKSGKKYSGRKPAIDEQTLKIYINEGKKDAEIAALLGVNRKTVVNTRKRLGLAENFSLNKDKLKKLHSKGKTDKEIAEVLGVSRRTIGMARQRLDLKPNKKKGRPATKPKVEITPEIENKVLHLLGQGYSPREVAKKYEITKSDVIKIYMKHQPRTWPEYKDKLNYLQRENFLMWRDRVDSIINKKVTLLEVETLKTQIEEIREEIYQLPPEKKGQLPTPEVMARMGVRNANIVDLTEDVKYVGMKHMINILQRKIERRYWAEIRRGINNMDQQTKAVAEIYLEEEIYIPFFAAEFPGIMAGLVKDTSKHKDIPGINLDTAADEPKCNKIEELFNEAQDKNTIGITRRRGKGGGERKSMEERCFWSN
ncbi:MAG: hypothetical protein FH758_04110 [Firmicutes bacterium]|nr:hypothetical protein [Bacillota bacterium]